VTERIAPSGIWNRVKKYQDRIKVYEPDAGGFVEPEEKTGTDTFLPLTTALMGDPFVTP